jgi:hypothetical protein
VRALLRAKLRVRLTGGREGQVIEHEGCGGGGVVHRAVSCLAAPTHTVRVDFVFVFHTRFNIFLCAK